MTVVCAIKNEGYSRTQSTGDGDGVCPLKISRRLPKSGCGRGRSSQLDKIVDLPAVQRQLEDPLVFNNRTDSGAAGLDQCGIRLYLNLLGHLTDFQHRIDDWIRVHLQ